MGKVTPPILNYETMGQRDRVLVIAAGPSTNEAIRKAKKWMDDRTRVIVTNYRFPIKANYTFFVKTKIFKQQHQKVDGKLVIASPLIKVGKYAKMKSKRWLMKRLRIFRCQKAPRVWNVDKITIDDNCIVRHDIASSGFGALLLATYSRPKHLMLLGFDGPTIDDTDKRKRKFVLDHFTGKTQTRPLDDLHKRIAIQYKKYLRDKIMPFLSQSGIENIYLCKEDRFRGINKKDLEVTVI
jgi:hypothetical protein